MTHDPGKLTQKKSYLLENDVFKKKKEKENDVSTFLRFIGHGTNHERGHFPIT